VLHRLVLHFSKVNLDDMDLRVSSRIASPVPARLNHTKGFRTEPPIHPTANSARAVCNHLAAVEISVTRSSQLGKVRPAVFAFAFAGALCTSGCSNRQTSASTAPSSSAPEPRVSSSLNLEPGLYTITVASDRSTSTDGAAPCAGFPDALLTRSYSATIAPSPSRSSTQFSVRLLSIDFALDIAGTAIGFTIDGPIISEALPGLEYVEIAGTASTAVPATITASGIAVPFSGSFVYCGLTSPMGPHNCLTAPAEQKTAFAQCLSDRDLMVLTRR
jgi:hypothetical protein